MIGGEVYSSAMVVACEIGKAGRWRWRGGLASYGIRAKYYGPGGARPAGGRPLVQLMVEHVH